MANQTIINQDFHVRGTISCERLVAPVGSIGDAAISATAGINESKLQHRHVFAHSQSGTVAAAIQYLHAMRFASEALSIEAAIVGTVATGNDRVVSVDLELSTGGGAFVSILTAPIEFDDGSVLRELVAGVLQSTDLVAGDILRLTVTVAGSAGAQAIGLIVTVNLRENAQ